MIQMREQLTDRRGFAPAQRWIQDGWRMARAEPEGVFDSIELKHVAETSAHRALVQQLKARGQTVVERRQELQTTLQACGVDAGQHLSDLAQGRSDAIWALGLMVLNGALAVFVLLGFGPWYLTLPLALLVLATALPVEEFFQANDERSALREGIFLTLALLALGAQFWLGTVRGLFLTALAPHAVGPVTEALRAAGPVLQYGLGILAMVSELVCGYKLYRARVRLFSPAARAGRAREVCERELVALVATLKAAEAEAEIRRAYRQVGARQYLAVRADAGRRGDCTHLARAAVGAIIALVVLALIFLAAPAFAEGRPERTVVIMLDLTKSVSPVSFEANVQTVGEILARIDAQQRVIVVGITDSFGRPAILFDRNLPSAGYLGLELQAARETLIADWRGLAKNLRPTYGQTDVLGTLSLLGYLGDLSMAEATLIVLSDLRQSSALLNIEAVSHINVEQVVARLKKANALPQLHGARVFLLGVEPTGKSAAYLSSLKALWTRLFSEAGAEVQLFSVNRRVPGF